MVALKMTSGVCFALLVHLVLSKSEQLDTSTHIHSTLGIDDYRRHTEDKQSILPLNYSSYAIPSRVKEVVPQDGGDGLILRERLGRGRTFSGTETVLSPAEKGHLEDLADAHPEYVEEAVEEMEPFFAKHMATMLIAYKLKMMILLPIFVVTVFLLAGSSGFAGLFFLLFIGSLWYRNKMGDPFPYKHELF